MAVPINVCLRRFNKNIQNPVMRRNVVLLLTGKLLRLVVVLALMQAFMPPVARASGQADDPTLEMNVINTAWTLIAAFLVFAPISLQLLPLITKILRHRLKQWQGAVQQAHTAQRWHSSRAMMSQ